MPTLPNERLRRLGRLLIGLIFSAGLLVGVAQLLDAPDAWERSKAVSPAYLGLAFVLTAALFATRALRFRALIPVPYRILFATSALHSFFTRIAPLRLGEITVPYLLHRHAHHPPASSVVALVLVRLMELWVLLSLGLVSWVAYFGHEHRDGALGLSAVLVASTVFVLAFYRLCLRMLRGARVALHRRQSKPREWMARILHKVERALEEARGLSARQWGMLMVSTVLVVCIQLVLYAVLLRGFGIELSLAQLALGTTATQLASALPAPTLGTFGIHEVGWTAGFSLVGVQVQEAVVTAVASQFITFAASCALALPCWLFLRNHRPGSTASTPLTPAGAAVPTATVTSQTR